VLVDASGMVIAGHARVKAAERLGLDAVPTICLDHLNEAQVRAYILADNAIALNAGWDEELLRAELYALESSGFDLALTGFESSEIDRLLEEAAAFEAAGSGGPGGEDLAPEPCLEATAQPGDLWILGDHRLLCGSSSIAADVDRLLGGVPIHLVNMDPPYNVKVEPRSNNAIAAGLSSFQAPATTHHQALDLARHPEKSKGTTKRMRAKDRPLMNDFVSDGDFDGMLRAWFGNAARVLEPGRGFYIWGGYANCSNYPSALKECGLYFSQAIIWDKEHPVLTRKDFMGAHEWCFYGWKEGGPHQFLGPNNATDLWHVKKINPQSMVHLTEKPVELARRAIEYSSRRGENVLDLFGGSGSTLIGAHETGRRAFLMELDPLYVDVILKRYQTFTGEPAVLESGSTFDEVAAERSVTDGTGDSTEV
jgi:DNA modification methylase